MHYNREKGMNSEMNSFELQDTVNQYHGVPNQLFGFDGLDGISSVQSLVNVPKEVSSKECTSKFGGVGNYQQNRGSQAQNGIHDDNIMIYKDQKVLRTIQPTGISRQRQSMVEYCDSIIATNDSNTLKDQRNSMPYKYSNARNHSNSLGGSSDTQLVYGPPPGYELTHQHGSRKRLLEPENLKVMVGGIGLRQYSSTQLSNKGVQRRKSSEKVTRKLQRSNLKSKSNEKIQAGRIVSQPVHRGRNSTQRVQVKQTSKKKPQDMKINRIKKSGSSDSYARNSKKLLKSSSGTRNQISKQQLRKSGGQIKKKSLALERYQFPPLDQSTHIAHNMSSLFDTGYMSGNRKRKFEQSNQIKYDSNSAGRNQTPLSKCSACGHSGNKSIYSRSISKNSIASTGRVSKRLRQNCPSSSRNYNRKLQAQTKPNDFKSLGSRSLSQSQLEDVHQTATFKANRKQIPNSKFGLKQRSQSYDSKHSVRSGTEKIVNILTKQNHREERTNSLFPHFGSFGELKDNSSIPNSARESKLREKTQVEKKRYSEHRSHSSLLPSQTVKLKQTDSKEKLSRKKNSLKKNESYTDKQMTYSPFQELSYLSSKNLASQQIKEDLRRNFKANLQHTSTSQLIPHPASLIPSTYYPQTRISTARREKDDMKNRSNSWNQPSLISDRSAQFRHELSTNTRNKQSQPFYSNSNISVSQSRSQNTRKKQKTSGFGTLPCENMSQRHSLSNLSKSSYLQSKHPNNLLAPVSTRSDLLNKSRSNQHLSGQNKSLVELKWQDMITVVEHHFKSRIAHLRKKVRQIVEARGDSLTTNSIDVQKELKSRMKLSMPRKDGNQEIDTISATSNFAELSQVIAEGLRIDQETLIASLKHQLQVKDQKFNSELRRVKDKYSQRKVEFNIKIKEADLRYRTQVELHGTELQRQVTYYRNQAEELQMKLRQDLGFKEREYQNAMKGTQDVQKRLEETQTEIEKLKNHNDYITRLKSESDQELERCRKLLSQVQKDAQIREAHQREDILKAQEELKQRMKEKNKAKIEQLEEAHAELMQTRVHEVETSLNELHQKDIKALSEKYELIIETKYLEIAEHEQIVQNIQRQDEEMMDERFNILNQETADKVFQFEQRCQEEALRERNNFEHIVQQYQEKIRDLEETMQEQIAAKDAMLADLNAKRHFEEVQELKEKMAQENHLRQQVIDLETKVKVMEQDQQIDKRVIGEKQGVIDSLDEEIHNLNQQLSKLRGSDAMYHDAKETVQFLQDQVGTLENEISSMQRKHQSQKQKFVWMLNFNKLQIEKLKDEVKQMTALVQTEVKACQNEIASKNHSVIKVMSEITKQISENQQQKKKLLESEETIKTLKSENEFLERGFESQKIQLKTEKEMYERVQTKQEKEKLEKEAELADLKVKVNRFEDKLEYTQKLITSYELKEKQYEEQVSKLQKEKDQEARRFVDSIEEKEKKLTEIFYKRLDKKVTKLQNDHQREIEKLKMDYYSEKTMLERDIQEYIAQIQSLQQIQMRQHEESKRKETKMTKQTQKIEDAVTKSLAKALGKSVQRKADALKNKNSGQIQIYSDNDASQGVNYKNQKHQNLINMNSMFNQYAKQSIQDVRSSSTGSHHRHNHNTQMRLTDLYYNPNQTKTAQFVSDLYKNHPYQRYECEFSQSLSQDAQQEKKNMSPPSGKYSQQITPDAHQQLLMYSQAFNPLLTVHPTSGGVFSMPNSQLGGVGGYHDQQQMLPIFQNPQAQMVQAQTQRSFEAKLEHLNGPTPQTESQFVSFEQNQKKMP